MNVSAAKGVEIWLATSKMLADPDISMTSGRTVNDYPKNRGRSVWFQGDSGIITQLVTSLRRSSHSGNPVPDQQQHSQRIDQFCWIVPPLRARKVDTRQIESRGSDSPNELYAISSTDSELLGGHRMATQKAVDEGMLSWLSGNSTKRRVGAAFRHLVFPAGAGRLRPSCPPAASGPVFP